LYRFYKGVGDDDDTPFTAKFPMETLALMDAIIPNDPTGIPFDLGQVLDMLAKIRPETTRDRRFNRLRELVAAK